MEIYLHEMGKQTPVPQWFLYVSITPRIPKMGTPSCIVTVVGSATKTGLTVKMYEPMVHYLPLTVLQLLVKGKLFWKLRI